MVTATYNPCGGVKTLPLYQYDYGQSMEFVGFDLPDTFEVHFANQFQGDAITQIAIDNVVTIPDMMLTSGANVYSWIVLHEGEEDGETIFYIEIPVIQRAEPTDDEPTPVEQSAITQAIAALNSAVETTSALAQSASESAENAETAYRRILVTGLSGTLLSSDDGAGNVNLYFEEEVE